MATQNDGRTGFSDKAFFGIVYRNNFAVDRWNIHICSFYISVFDFGIIWMIEYTDILKFAFIALDISSWLVTLLFSVSIITILSVQSTRNNIVFFVFIIVIILIALLDIWFHRQIEGRWIYSWWIYSLGVPACYLLTIYLIFAIRDFIIKWPDNYKWDTFATVATFIVAISALGTTYGLSVKFSGPNHNDVWVKECTDVT
jgi:hypothetical protein